VDEMDVKKVIETDEEFDHMAARLEELYIPERELTAEEEALASLLEKLIEAYDAEYHAIPEAKPNEMVQYLEVFI
jgi:antitoxin component HigA of HigAB toxin-antitoxin module